jgi:hypothetical protein
MLVWRVYFRKVAARMEPDAIGFNLNDKTLFRLNVGES